MHRCRSTAFSASSRDGGQDGQKETEQPDHAASFRVINSDKVFGTHNLHLTAMLGSVYILIGDGVNEAFLRVNALHRLVPNFNSQVIGIPHLTDKKTGFPK